MNEPQLSAETETVPVACELDIPFGSASELINYLYIEPELSLDPGKNWQNFFTSIHGQNYWSIKGGVRKLYLLVSKELDTEILDIESLLSSSRHSDLSTTQILEGFGLDNDKLTSITKTLLASQIDDILIDELSSSTSFILNKIATSFDTGFMSAETREDHDIEMDITPDCFNYNDFTYFCNVFESKINQAVSPKCPYVDLRGWLNNLLDGTYLSDLLVDEYKKLLFAEPQHPFQIKDPPSVILLKALQNTLYKIATTDEGDVRLTQIIDPIAATSAVQELTGMPAVQSLLFPIPQQPDTATTQSERDPFISLVPYTAQSTFASSSPEYPEIPF